ncbi:uncharacterized protein K444DRAFT_721968 [Hyaloscypha bicolor E]|uniref:Uncharacterized protein n=1 Tax=Hyaloscypha bicolor E TaxID=1095630 RepID=A0A2J6TAT0_9HELO|nr:uncharacterized protein K444DRAFT_721968 [Hyaloscypha bicolor E]PMD60111.1 hypothetical protein K444DRAFT_721968 [Hyaloscypha bicolor E]
MLKHTLLLAAFISIAAGQIGVLVPQQFSERSIPKSGGWSLQANTCPTGTAQCGAAWCCPNSLTCVRSGLSDNAEACCPTADTCQPSLQAAPVCADSSWNLWNTTNVDGAASDGYTGYLCCLAGQIGIQGNVETVGMSAICVDPGTPFPQSVSGTLIAPAAATQSSTSQPTGTAATTTSSTTSTGTAAGSTGKSDATNIIPAAILSISGVVANVLAVALLP